MAKLMDSLDIAISYYNLGASFQAAAERLAKTLELKDDGTPKEITIAVPTYFLISHAAELYLKAALLKRGYSSSDLKKQHGHDLQKLFTALHAKVSLTDHSRFLLEGLHKNQNYLALRYSVFLDDGKSVFWPPVSCLFTMLDELLSATRLSHKPSDFDNSLS